MKNILLTIFIIFFSLSAAQEKIISGKILDLDGNPQAGVEVYSQENYGNSVLRSDYEGNYSINIKVGETICFSYVHSDRRRILRKINSFYKCTDISNTDKIIDVQNGYNDTVKIKRRLIPSKYGDNPGFLPTEMRDDGNVYEYYYMEDDEYGYKYWIPIDLNLRDRKSFENKFNKELRHPLEGIYEFKSGEKSYSTAIFLLNKDKSLFLEVMLENDSSYEVGDVVSEIKFDDNKYFNKDLGEVGGESELLFDDENFTIKYPGFSSTGKKIYPSIKTNKKSNSPTVILDESLRIDVEKTIAFLDFLNNSMQGISVAQSVTEAKRLANHETNISFGRDGYSKLLTNKENGTQYFTKTAGGEYLYIIENKIPNNYLGYFIKGGNPVIRIYIFSNSSDFYAKNTITRINTRLLFMRRSDNQKNIKQIEDNFKTAVNNFYLNKCTTGLSNPMVGNQINSMGNILETSYRYDIIGPGLLTDDFKPKADCIPDCQSCYLNLTFGLATSGAEINEGWSKALHIEIADKLLSTFSSVSKNMMDELDYKVRDPKNPNVDIDLREINTFDLLSMIEFFIEDYKQWGGKLGNQKINASFEELGGGVIALAYGMNDDANIKIKVDPIEWRNSSKQKKWYILYHELGHDVLNLEHGNGGKMMFNFADREYTWEEFVDDKKYMFKSKLK